MLGDKPEGTGYVPVRAYGEGGVGTWGGTGGGIFTRFEEGEDETTTSGEEVDNVEPPRPTLPAPESNDSQPLIITVTGSPNDLPGAGEWILERGKVVESCLSGKTLYCVGEWRANDSKSRNFLAEKARIDQLRREFEDIASRHNFLRTILKGDAIEELGGEKVYLENRPGFSPYVITNVIEGRLIKQLWVRSPRPGSMGKVVYTNWLMVPGEISNSDLARIYEKHLDSVETEAATQVLVDVLLQVGGELIVLRMAKAIGPGGAAVKSTQLLDNADDIPLEKLVYGAPNSVGGWISRPEGTRLKQVGNYWIKEVDPSASAIQQWWGRGSLNAQARALNKLGDMATPHLFKNGKLVMRDAGQFDGSAVDFLSIRVKGSWRLGTPFNDLWPRNIGANGLAFDPALHPIHEGIYWVGTGVVIFKGGELLYYEMQGEE